MYDTFDIERSIKEAIHNTLREYFINGAIMPDQLVLRCSPKAYVEVRDAYCQSCDVEYNPLQKLRINSLFGWLEVQVDPKLKNYDMKIAFEKEVYVRPLAI